MPSIMAGHGLNSWDAATHSGPQQGMMGHHHDLVGAFYRLAPHFFPAPPAANLQRAGVGGGCLSLVTLQLVAL